VAREEDSDLGTYNIDGAVFHLILVKRLEKIFVDALLIGCCKSFLDFGYKSVSAAKLNETKKVA
jgi:hypothetical protein